MLEGISGGLLRTDGLLGCSLFGHVLAGAAGVCCVKFALLRAGCFIIRITAQIVTL